MSTDQASSSSPVWPSTRMSARPSAPREHLPHGQHRRGQGHQAEQHRPAAHAAEHRQQERQQHERGVEPAGVAVAEDHGQGALADDLVRRDVAQVVGHEHRAREHPDGDGAHDRERVRRPALRQGGAEHRDRPEEDEHGHLAEPGVPVRSLAARVEPGARHAQRAHGDQPPLPRQRHEGQPGQPGHGEGDEGGGADGRRRGTAFEPTSRAGPTRSSSVPRMPSE